jgi:hypothetical protein
MNVCIVQLVPAAAFGTAHAPHLLIGSMVDTPLSSQHCLEIDVFGLCNSWFQQILSMTLQEIWRLCTCFGPGWITITSCCRWCVVT